MLLVEMKDFNALIDSKQYFDHYIKHLQQLYKKIVETSRYKMKIKFKSIKLKL